MKAIRVILLLVVLSGLDCKEREPYPARPPTTPLPEAPAPEPPQETVPLVLLVTPEGSFFATARSDGSDLDVRKVPGWVYVREDGSLVRFEVRTEIDKKRRRDKPRFEFARLVWRSKTEERTLFPPSGQVRLDVQRLSEADPDMASLYYHTESIEPLGVLGSSFAWIVKVGGFTGGAHDYSETSLLVADAETGLVSDLVERFGPQDPVAEALKGVGAEECLRRFAGVAGYEGLGGEPAYVALLVHEFEVCRGRSRLVRIASQTSKTPSTATKTVRLEGGVLETTDGMLRVPGVVDYRASPDGRAVVMLMSLGAGDRPPIPVSDASDKPKSREVRLWVRGGPSPVVLGRATRILTAQFLGDHKARSAIIEAFAGQ